VARRPAAVAPQSSTDCDVTEACIQDIRLTMEAAESQRVPMPLGSLLHDRFLRLLAQGGDSLDWAAIGGLATQDAGDA
jgi:3-hydroxyisobutyrate dehydrogenase-like beta-hydroxyacid dehydrogenase